MMINVFYIIAGLVLLFFSGDLLIRGSVTIAEKFHLSNVFISAVVIGFGTSMPEFMVSLDAVLNGFHEIALGNIIGSNISNVLFVLGIAAIIRPVSCKSSHIPAYTEYSFQKSTGNIDVGEMAKIVEMHLRQYFWKAA